MAKMLTEAQKSAKSIKSRAEKAGKLGGKFTHEAAACLVLAFAHTLKHGDDTIIGHTMDRLGPALNRRQVDAWVRGSTNMSWSKKEGTYKKKAGQSLAINLEVMTEVPYYDFVRENTVPDKMNILSAFISFIGRARLNTEVDHAVDSDGILAKVMKFAKDNGIELKDTVPTKEQVSKLKAKLTVPDVAEGQPV